MAEENLYRCPSCGDDYTGGLAALVLDAHTAALRSENDRLRGEVAKARAWARGWRLAATRRERVWSRAAGKVCVCEAGRIRVGDGRHWRWGDCPFCKSERLLSEAREVLRWVANNYRATLGRRSVRDADECLAAADRLLAPPPEASGTVYRDNGEGWGTDE